MNNLSDKILAQIDAAKITPIPRWRFLAIRGAFWFLACASVILGGFPIAAMIFLLSDFHRHGLWGVPHDIMDIFAMIPFLWISVLILFMIVAKMGMKHTKYGYKYPPRLMVLLSILGSVILGSVLNYYHVGRMVHHMMRPVPGYTRMVREPGDEWRRPDMGRLMGKVTTIDDVTHFTVTDPFGHVWNVVIVEPLEEPFTPAATTTVRMHGTIDDSTHTMTTHSIHVWEVDED